MASGKNNPTAPALSMRAKIACLAVFVIVTIGVALFAQQIRHGAPTAEECVAVAAVRGVVAAENRAAFNADALAVAIVSKEHLAQFSLPGLPDATVLAGHLRASVAPLSPRGETTLTIACCQPTAEKAAAVANGLVQHYAQQADQAWQVGAEKAYRESRGEVQARQQTLLAAHREFERFLEQPQPNPASAARLIVPQAAAAAAPVIAPPNTIFPASLGVQQKIDALVRRREELLRTVTELHPAVRDTDLQIERAKAELAVLPGATAEPADALAATTPPAELPPDPPPVLSAQERPGFRQHKESVENAQQALAAAFDGERSAWTNLRNRPPIRLQLAQPSHMGPQPAPPLRAILMPIIAGLAAALLALQIAEARSHVPRIRTKRQLERAAAVPVLGTVTIG